ncbi:angiopoietin-4 [Gopherus flavomarginatus]|uniref:angiopoietin-4 n=1 Tax=Gopherus flavomarginatus TaxID=286002 RepID=UPI0021CC06E8|nr:angiopoietin-4 [Gopherus flavomarginatus]
MHRVNLKLVAFACVTVAFWAEGGQRRATGGGSRRRSHRVQQGQCSYTFVLPEADLQPCPPTRATLRANTLQGDSPAATLQTHNWSAQRMQQLERVLENNTQWLLKLERYVQMNVKSEMVRIQQNVAQNQTATMLEIGTSLLNQMAEQSRKLTAVEAQILNQTTRIEIQLLETSLSTNKLEKQLLLQTTEIHKLQNMNNVLETRVLEMETKHQTELEGIRTEKEKLQRLVSHQSHTIEDLEKSLHAANSNTSLLQRQQLQLLESVQSLVQLVSQGKAPLVQEQQVSQDCAQNHRAGFNTSGIYTLHVTNMTEPRKVFCDMETDRGGWTVIQRRTNGSVNFQRKWKEYKQGFGDPAGEYWLGNEAVHLLTSQASYSLRVELLDWEGNQAYAHYETFQLGSERHLYRISLKGYSGTAGQQSGIVLQGINFSTRDSDNDNCLCKCAQMLSGGWWFDACGLSNLNGIYYPAKHNVRKLNGIRWHYFQGPSYSLKGTRMMIRPSDF